METTQTVTDWRHEARTLLAAGYGQRESARLLGIPEERLKKWAQRNGIAVSIQRTLANVPMSPASSPNVPTAAQIIAESSVEDAKACRVGLIRRARTVIEAAVDRAAVDPEKALLEAPLIASEAATLQRSNAQGFERREAGTAGVVVNLAILDRPPQ